MKEIEDQLQLKVKLLVENKEEIKNKEKEIKIQKDDILRFFLNKWLN